MMTNDMKPKVLFFGVGSVGAFYLYLVSKVATTTAVCRSNYEIVKEKGFIINSNVIGEGLHITPNVVRTCEEAVAQDPLPFDYVVLTNKVIPGIYPKLLKPVITPGHTVIALLQNGIGIEEEWAAAFPDNPIVTAATYCATVQQPPGVVEHREVERLEVGSYPSSAPNTHAQAITTLFQSAGATATLFEDVQRNRWYKLFLNVGWNPTCALSRCTDVELMKSSEGATDFILDIFMEGRNIALAYGYEFSREEVEAQWERAKKRVATNAWIEPSMLQDVKAGNKTEVEAIVGNAVRMAKAKNVTCLRLETIYVLMKALDARMGRPAWRE